MQPQKDDADLERMKSGRSTPLIVGGLVVLLAAGGGLGYYFWSKSKGSSKNASKTYGALWGCMVGDPLEGGESLESRLRSINAATDDKTDWPKRCDKEATNFYESLGTDAKSEGVRELMELEVKCATSCSATALLSRLGQINDAASSARINPDGAADYKDKPARLEGQPLGADAFTQLIPGTALLKAMTSIGEGKTALLFRDSVPTLHVCEVAPDAEKPVRCGPITLPITRLDEARLVEGKTSTTIYGITQMGATPEEMQFGVFDAWTSQPTEDVPADVKKAAGAALPPVSAKWVDADLDGTHITVSRAANGVLRIVRGKEAPRWVMDDSEHGGPGSGDPITFLGKKRALVLFTGKSGLIGLSVDGQGTFTPLIK